MESKKKNRFAKARDGEIKKTSWQFRTKKHEKLHIQDIHESFNCIHTFALRN